MAAVVSGTHDLVQLLTRNLSSWRTDVSGDAVFLDGLGTKSIPDPTTAGDFCRRLDTWAAALPGHPAPPASCARWHHDSILASGRNWFETVSQCAGAIIWRHE